MAIRAVISDFGGVLTTPLPGGFRALQAHSQIAPAQFGAALAALSVARGENPLHALESGRMSEPEFMAAIAEELTAQLGRPVPLERFGETFLSGLAPNEPYIAHLRGLRTAGLRLAICTNNVGEWSARWQAMIPRELFEVVVDSSAVGTRKPDPRIYEVTLAELGLTAPETAFVDDLEENVTAAAALGMHAVWFQSTEQAIAALEAALVPVG